LRELDQAAALARSNLVDYLRADKSRCHAFWRPTDGTPEVFLCSINRAAYETHSHLRELLVELANEVQINHKRAAGNSLCLRAREPMPKTFRYPLNPNF